MNFLILNFELQCLQVYILPLEHPRTLLRGDGAFIEKAHPQRALPHTYIFCIAGHYILLNAQFLAVVHIIVYAGAIMVLFLFTVMLLNLNKDERSRKPSG